MPAACTSSTPCPGAVPDHRAAAGAGNAVSRTAVTDRNGFYSFAEVTAGNYVLTETPPAGLLDGRVSVGTQGGTTSNRQIAFAYRGNAAGVNNDFGKLPASSLAGF